MRIGFFGLVACALAAPWASAQLVLTSDQRAIAVEAAGINQTAVPSGAFAPFSKDLGLNVPSGGGFAKAQATETSTLSPAALAARGSSAAESQAGPANCVLAQATSDFRLTFRVDTPVEYTLSGSVDGAQFRLAESISGVVHLVQAAAGTSKPFSFGGVLKPGRNYLLLAQSSQLSNACNGSSFALSGEYALDAAFTSLPPCPGDLNFDRVVNDADFELFLIAYNNVLCADPPQPCDADLNGDGVVDDLDFQGFLLGYNELICPP